LELRGGVILDSHCFIDHFSNYIVVALLKKKSDTFEAYKQYSQLVQNHTNRPITTLRTDNGSEYINKEFSTFLKEQQTIHETTVPYNPQQNGKAERLNQTLMNGVRTLLIDSSLPQEFWSEALLNVTYTRNRCPSSAISTGQTPYEIWYQRKPDLNSMHIFGEIAYAKLPAQRLKKLDARSKGYIFMGYAQNQKGYRLLNWDNKKITISRDVYFPKSPIMFSFSRKEDSN
jgi:Integrase core domain